MTSHHLAPVSLAAQVVRVLHILGGSAVVLVSVNSLMVLYCRFVLQQTGFTQLPIGNRDNYSAIVSARSYPHKFKIAGCLPISAITDAFWDQTCKRKQVSLPER